MIYSDVSSHQLQSGGIFETPHVKPRNFVSQERLDQSEQNEGIFVDLWIPEFLPVQCQRMHEPHKMFAHETGFRLKPQLILWERDDRETYV